MSFNVVFSVMGDPCMSYTQEKLEIVLAPLRSPLRGLASDPTVEYID